MNKYFSIILGATLMCGQAVTIAGCSDSSAKDGENTDVVSTKRERNSIKEGNKLYEQQRYAEAEVAYKKALEENPDNATAQFNLASSYLKQRGEDLSNKGDSLIRTADAMLGKVAQSPQLAEPAFYDRGNVAYKAEDYASAIEMYKNALRRNPENNQARENLRLAQLKKQEQDQQNQNQDQNQDQQQDQQQNQNKDQQQDQNKEQDNKDQQQNQPDINQQTADQILKAMENKENQTRARVTTGNQGDKSTGRNRTRKNW